MRVLSGNLKFIIASLVFGCSLVYYASSATGRLEAHNALSGRWATGTTLRWYYFGTPKTFKSYVALADDGWNAAQNKVTFLHTTNSSLRNLAVKDFYHSTSDPHYGDLAYVSDNFSYCGCIYSGHEHSNSTPWELVFNNSQLDPGIFSVPYGQTYDGFMKKLSAHELGHVLGLGHWFTEDIYSGSQLIRAKDPEPPYANSTPSIMKFDIYPLMYSEPKPHDISDLNAIYP